MISVRLSGSDERSVSEQLDGCRHELTDVINMKQVTSQVTNVSSGE